jgi:hypothetical protein
MNNFYNEPAHAKILAELVPKTGVIPPEIRTNYVKTLILCRMGNSYGVSFAAKEYYDELISRFQEADIQQVILLIKDKEVSSRFQYLVCAARFLTICNRMKQRASNAHTISALDTILKMSAPELSAADITKAFTSLLTSLTLD